MKTDYKKENFSKELRIRETTKSLQALKYHFDENTDRGRIIREELEMIIYRLNGR